MISWRVGLLCAMGAAIYGLAIADGPSVSCDEAVLRTLAHGVKTREEGVHTLDVELLSLSLRTGGASYMAPLGAPWGGDGNLHALHQGISRHWIRVVATDAGYREETVTLPDPNSEASAMDTAGTVRSEQKPVDSPWARMTTIHDGSKRILWNDRKNLATVRWDEWGRRPVETPAVREALMFGKMGCGFAEAIEGITGYADTLEVEAIESETAPTEYRVRLRAEKEGEGGTVVNECEFFVVPEWGYAVRRWEQTRVIMPGPRFGTSVLQVATDWREVGGGIWVPFEATATCCTYIGSTTPARSSFISYRALYARANAPVPEALLTFHPPLGVSVYDETGTFEAAERTQQALDAAVAWSQASASPVVMPDLGVQPNDATE